MSNLPLESNRWRWQRQGQWKGGLVTCMAAQGQICLAGTVAGLFRSVDAGNGWMRVEDGLGHEGIQAVAVIAGYACTATQSGRLVQSQDAGATWQPISSWVYGVIQCIACANTRKGDVAIFAGTAEGVYRSLDSGQSWQEANFGLLDTDVLCLACAPDFAEGEVIWLGTALGGLYRSRNGGRAWRESGDGLADAAVLCMGLSSNFNEDRTALIGLEGQGLFRSTDGGGHWEPQGLEGEDVHAILPMDVTGGWLVGTANGLYECADPSSTHWKPLPLVSGVTSVALAHSAEGAIEGERDVLLVGTLNQGVIQLTQGSDGWQSATADGIAAHAPPLVVATAKGTLFALDNTGLVVYSNDDGATWPRCAFDTDLSDDSPTAGAQGDEIVALVGADQLYRWEADRATFCASANVPVVEEDEVTVVAVDVNHSVWVGTRNGHIQHWWSASELWETIPTPIEGMIVDLRSAVDGSHIEAVIVRPEPDGRYTAELWRLTQSPSSENAWTMLVALDHLPQPFACVATEADAPTSLLAGHNMLAIHSANASARLVDLGAETRITAVMPFDHGWCVATSRGICLINEDGDAPMWSLVGYPVVALLSSTERIQAVTLGGEIWALSSGHEGSLR